MVQNILVLLLSVCVVSHASICIKETFEPETFNVSFSKNSDICTEIPTVMWKTRRYFDTKLTPPHELSTEYIYPETTLTCMSSPTFRVEPQGTVKVNVFMDAIATTDQILVLAHESVSDMTDLVTGMVALTPLGAGYVRGWQTLKLTIGGTTPHDGYISFMGMSAEASIVLIDSFRYLPPGKPESDCELYELETTTTETATETTIETTTAPISPTTPEVICKRKMKFKIDW